MASQAVESHRVGAEVVKGDEACRKRSVEVLEEMGLPNGLFPLVDMEEFGYNRESGFVWILQKKKIEHTFKKIRAPMSYATEVTAFVEKRKLKKVTGIKTREMLLWLSVIEIYFEKEDSEKITFKTGTGLDESFPASAFNLGA